MIAELLVLGLVVLPVFVVGAIVVRHFRSPKGRVRHVETVGAVGRLHVQIVTEAGGSRFVGLQLARGSRLRLTAAEASQLARLLRLAAGPHAKPATGPATA